MAKTVKECICPCCTNPFIIEVSRYNYRLNRTSKSGVNNIYCSRICSGIGRRVSKEQKIENKRLYDIQYREKNKENLKQKKKTYNESKAGREMQKRNRDKFKQSHLEYCRTPEYKSWKREYDQEHVFKTKYGEKEWLKTKECINCNETKLVKNFAYSKFYPEGRLHICVQCEKKHQIEYGINTVYVVTAIVNTAHKHGGKLTRKDIHKYPYFIESYKFNILLKRLLI